MHVKAKGHTFLWDTRYYIYWYITINERERDSFWTHGPC